MASNAAARDLDAIRDLAVALAREAGALQLARRADLTVRGAKAHANDLVSDVDLASERLIVAGIDAEWPDDGLLAEEGSRRSGKTGWTWVVDPLDGTRNYVSGAGPWSVTMAVRADSRSVVGVVHEPVTGETFTAVDGRGAFLDGRPISVSECSQLGRALVGPSFDPSPVGKRRVARLLSVLLPDIGDLRRIPAALHLAYLADGRLDCGVLLEVQPWDVAGGLLIAAEAGAWLGDGGGGPASTRLTVAAAPGVRSDFVALVTAGSPTME